MSPTISNRILKSVFAGLTLTLIVLSAVPARADVDVRLEFQALPPDSLFPGSPTTLALVLGGGDAVKAEKVLAFELGYRLRPAPNLFVDLAAFYNRHYRE